MIRLFLILLIFISCDGNKDKLIDKEFNKLLNLVVNQEYFVTGDITNDIFFDLINKDNLKYDLCIQISFQCFAQIVLNIISHNDKWVFIIYTRRDKIISKKRVIPKDTLFYSVRYWENIKLSLPKPKDINNELKQHDLPLDLLDGIKYSIKFNKKTIEYNDIEDIYYHGRSYELPKSRIVIFFLKSLRESFNISICPTLLFRLAGQDL